ncbi:response regulator transcription factor [uncultured Tenacibaculum sp.]|uniref:response regulator n=1 Tax=uncultured Tenacibaculum sp. TaxID=174713 RepID=UPI00260F2072|nr:response regulator transcription factor [uncultured Tenacibaculum sp.]
MKVFITDDHEIVIDGVKALLKTSSFDVVGSSKTGQGVLDWLENNDCDIVLLDMKLPDMIAVDVLKNSINLVNQPKFLITSGSTKINLVQDTIILGAYGFITKDELSQNLEEALNRIKLGKKYYSQILIDSIIARQLEQETRVSIDSILTPTESKALKLLVSNVETEDICETMNITKSSFNTLVSRMSKKLGVKKKIGLVILAIKHRFNSN